MNSGETNDAERTRRERRARMIAALAADMETRIAPSPAIDPEIMAEYERSVRQFESRKDVPR